MFDITFFFFVIVILLAIIQGKLMIPHKLNYYRLARVVNRIIVAQ